MNSDGKQKMSVIVIFGVPNFEAKTIFCVDSMYL